MLTPKRGSYATTAEPEDVRERALGWLRTIYPAAAKKRIARDFSVSVETAKAWLSRGLPLRRVDEVIERLDAAIEVRERELRQIREQLASARQRRP
jgi:hypothetical protein